METKNEKKSQNGLIRVVLLALLFGLGFWVYQQNIANYETLSGAIKTTENLWDHQIAVTKDYAKKLALVQDNFKKTEALLSRVQEENRRLNEQIALLSNVQNLQSTASRLKTENTEVMQEIRDLRQQVAFESKNLSNIDEGKELIRKFKDRIRNVKVRIKELRNDQYIQKIAVQQEKDRMGLMLGNNGFMTRNGEQTAVDFKRPNKGTSEVEVNVTIIK